MTQLEELDDRLQHLGSTLEALILKKPLNAKTRKYLAWKKELDYLISKIKHVTEKKGALGTTVQVIRITGECKTFVETEDGKIAVPRTFRVFFSGITEEDGVKIIKEKLNLIDFKTISIKTLKLGEIEFLNKNK